MTRLLQLRGTPLADANPAPWKRDTAPEERHCMCGTKISRYNPSNQCHACRSFDASIDVALPDGPVSADPDEPRPRCACGCLCERRINKQRGVYYHHECNGCRRRRKPQLAMRDCPECAESFTQRHPKQVYCCASCGKAAANRRRRVRDRMGLCEAA